MNINSNGKSRIKSKKAHAGRGQETKWKSQWNPEWQANERTTLHHNRRPSETQGRVGPNELPSHYRALEFRFVPGHVPGCLPRLRLPLLHTPRPPSTHHVPVGRVRTPVFGGVLWGTSADDQSLPAGCQPAASVLPFSVPLVPFQAAALGAFGSFGCYYSRKKILLSRRRVGVSRCRCWKRWTGGAPEQVETGGSGGRARTGGMQNGGLTTGWTT